MDIMPTLPLHQRAFCETLLFTGCRISEALSLTASAIQPEVRLITFKTLKRRDTNAWREIPVPQPLIASLQEQANATDGLVWQHNGHPIHRITAYRWIKRAMALANVSGVHACPKGLRHGYGIHAIRCGVQLNMVQKWMGHAHMSTTAIYTNASGIEEREIADRMWTDG